MQSSLVEGKCMMMHVKLRTPLFVRPMYVSATFISRSPPTLSVPLGPSLVQIQSQNPKSQISQPPSYHDHNYPPQQLKKMSKLGFGLRIYMASQPHTGILMQAYFITKLNISNYLS